MKLEVTSEEEYKKTLETTYELMNKGEANLTEKQLKKLERMAIAAEEYEDTVLGLKPESKPQTIAAIVEQKMYEGKMTQATLAAKLGFAQSKLSEILNGKRKPDLPFLKALYTQLNIDPAFLLEHS